MVREDISVLIGTDPHQTHGEDFRIALITAASSGIGAATAQARWFHLLSPWQSSIRQNNDASH